MIPEIVLSAGVITWITALLSLTVALVIKDFLTTLVAGFFFFLNREFSEGHHVYIDGEEAVIIKVGIRITIFEIKNGRGETWRYVRNDKIKDLKLERVITPKILTQSRRTTDKPNGAAQ